MMRKNEREEAPRAPLRTPSSGTTRLTLSRAELERMPSKVLRQLAAQLADQRGPDRLPGWLAGMIGPGPASLDRSQLAALLREITFHRDGKRLLALLHCLAYGSDGFISRTTLAATLQRGEQPNLRRYIGAINRLCEKATKQRGLRLCRYAPGKRGYALHQATARALREALPELEHAGEQEEPLWE